MQIEKVSSFINQKGGVGKTTTALNLAAAVAAAGKRVLLIDMDPQGNATTGLGIPRQEKTIYGALMGLYPLQQAIAPSFLSTLDVAPSTPDLAGAEIELVPLAEREKYLSKTITPILPHYDHIFIDCPPSLGLLSLNALACSHGVLIPVQCEFYALDGLGRLLHTLKKIRLSINPHLTITGIIMTMFDRRFLLNQQVVQEVKNTLKDLVFPVFIPRSIRVSEAASHGKPVLFYDRRCAVSLAYIELARQLLAQKIHDTSHPHLQESS